MKTLQILKFLPAGLALFNGKANPSGNVVPVGAEVKICLQLNETAVSVADPKHPNALGSSVVVLVRVVSWVVVAVV